MPEVRVALRAFHFGAGNAVADVGLFDDVILFDGRIKTGPAGAGIEFRVGAKQLGSAANAAEDAFVVNVQIFAGERRFGGRSPRDFKLVGRQLLSPLRFGFLDHRHRDRSSQFASIAAANGSLRKAALSKRLARGAAWA